MKKVVNSALKLVVILSLILLPVCCSQNSSNSSNYGGDPDDNNRIKVKLINAESVDDGTDCYFRIFENGDDPDTDNEIEIMRASINGERASNTSKEYYPDGEKYDIWVVVDHNDNADDDDPEADGGDRYNAAAYNVAIDGDETITIDYNDLAIEP